MPDDARTSLVVGSRLLAGWACAAVGVLNLSMGADTADQPYLLFHLVLLLGGLLLLGFGKLPKTPKALGYAVICVLAVAASSVAALPSTQDVCCLFNLAVRHGYPLTLIAWDAGQPRHFAPAHAVADFVFWYLAGLILLALITQILPGRRSPAGPAARPEDQATLRVDDQANPASRVKDQATHAEGRAVVPGEPAPVADDENVGGLP